MKDIKIKAKSYDLLAGTLTDIKEGVFVVKYKDILAPTKGTAAGTDEFGNAYPAKGNKDYWYAAVRVHENETEPTITKNIEKAEDTEAVDVLGVWA